MRVKICQVITCLFRCCGSHDVLEIGRPFLATLNLFKNSLEKSLGKSNKVYLRQWNKRNTVFDYLKRFSHLEAKNPLDFIIVIIFLFLISLLGET